MEIFSFSLLQFKSADFFLYFYLFKKLHYINEFHQLTNYNHSLKIYVKCPTNVSEFQFIDQLITKSNNIKNTKAVHYYLDTIKYGMWGNPKDYVHLLKSLDIKVKQSIVPEILLK